MKYKILHNNAVEVTLDKSEVEMIDTAIQEAGWNFTDPAPSVKMLSKLGGMFSEILQNLGK